MKKNLLIILLCSPAFCFAQQKLEYANFIQTDTAIKWAAVYNSYVNLTTVNPNFNIRNFYINKLKKQGAVAYQEEDGVFAVTPVKTNYTDYVAGFKKVDYDPALMNWWFDYDKKADGSATAFNMDINACDTCTMKNALSFFKVKQLLFYKDNQLQIRNILLAPVLYKKTKNAKKEGIKYFESKCFAFDAAEQSDNIIPASAKLIGRSCNDLMLLPTPDSLNNKKILTLENWSLSKILYNGIKSKQLGAYSTEKSIYPDNKKALDPATIENYKMPEYIVPFFDSSGNITKYQTIKQEVNFDSIYNFTLVQDFYFDFNNEKLYSKPIALVARMNVYTSSGIFIGLSDYWGIIFPKGKNNNLKK